MKKILILMVVSVFVLSTVTSGQQRQSLDAGKDLSIIESLTMSRDLDGLLKFSDEIDARWRTDLRSWARLRSKICDSLSSYDFGDVRQYRESIKLATDALSKFDTLPIDVEFQLLVKLRSTTSYFPARESIEQWPSDRKKRLDLALRFWRRIDREFDHSFNVDDPKNRPIGNVPVPGGAYPAGVNPEVIVDNTMREKYKAAIANNRAKAERYNYQIELKRLRELFPDFIEKTLVEFYSMRPSDRKDLSNFLTAFELESVKRNLIISAVEKNLSESP